MKLFGHAPHRVIAQASPEDIEGLIDTLQDADIIAEREPKRAMAASLMAATCVSVTRVPLARNSSNTWPALSAHVRTRHSAL